ncbi:MAG: glycosyltransferase family 39 protein [Anaerolineales bacterium]|nr:MAG: glycosyltransferase family 39 protein [Anaerolineales bacterium]
MTSKSYITLGLAGLLVFVIVGSLQRSPGYMDAEYYLLTGQQLAAGRGFTEPVLWNYLDAPSGLPHPSHAYWMPLPSLLAALGTALFGVSFSAGRVLFLIVAALVPPLTAKLCMQLTGRRGSARLAGFLAVLPGFYLPFITTTDSFAICMLLGGVFFLLISREEKPAWWALALGGVAGLLHLARAEGPLWLLLALYASWRTAGARGATQAGVGYLVVMLAWFVRNWLAFGSLLAPGAGSSLWLTEYDELFSFPASQLSMQAWAASGLGAIVAARVSALGQNLASAVVVSGLVALAPLVVWGAWRLRTQPAVRVGSAAWLALLLVFSFVFPFSGARGGFFHAAAVVQPLVWALAAAGLHAALEWGSAVRGWQVTRAGHVFSIGILVLALGLSAYAVQQRVLAGGWDASAAHYTALHQRLQALGVGDGEIVMVNNPPGFSLAGGGRPAIVIPHGGPQAGMQAARQYGARILLLGEDQPGWSDIYEAGPLLSSLQYLDEVDGTRIFRLP